MPWIKGEATSFEDLIEQTISYMTDKEIHGEDAWELMRNEPWPKGTILKCKGLKAGDHFYLGLMPLDIVKEDTYRRWFMQWDNAVLAAYFVWAKNGLNLRSPFTSRGVSGHPDGVDSVILERVEDGLNKMPDGVLGFSSKIWGALLDALGEAEEDGLYTYLSQAKPRVMGATEDLVIFFTNAYEKQRTEKRENINKIERILRANGYTGGPVKCELISPVVNTPPVDPSLWYHFHRPDIFSDSAKALYFGVFKQYSDGLDWHEQPGGMDFSNLPLMTVSYNNGSYLDPNTAIEWVPPIFPGAGYPAIGMDPEGPMTGKLDFYLIKNKCGMTLVTNNIGTDKTNNWETVYAGLFEPYADYEYAFPAAVIGGTSGLTMKGEVRHKRRAVTGLKFDYRPKNWSLIHGAAAFSCAGLDSQYCPTQTMLMVPDGTWRSFANYVQGVDTIYPAKSEDIYFPIAQPKRPQNISGFIRPAERELNEYWNLYNGIEDESQIKTGYKFEPIEFVEKKSNSDHAILGRLPNFYHCTRPIYRHGEVMISGKRYLILPSVWENRKFHLPYRGSDLLGQYNPDRLLAEDKATEFNRKKMEGLMNTAILLEDE